MTTFTVFTKPDCPQCDMAKALLDAKAQTYKTIIVDVGQPRMPGHEYVTKAELLQRIPTARSVPQILSGEEVIGGYMELKKHLS